MDRSFPSTVRMVDIARRAGCSHAAVSHVLTGAGAGKIRVSAKKAILIRRIARQLDFQPNHAARQLKGMHSHILGIISRNWRDVFQLRMFSWLQQSAAGRGYQVLASQCQTPAELREAARTFRSRDVDGALCYAPLWEDPQPGLERVLSQWGPVVSLFGPVGMPGCGCVELDEADGIRQAVAHLHQRGRRRIALLLERESASTRSRRDGYLSAHRDLRLAVCPQLQYAGTADWVWDLPGFEQRVDAVVRRLALDEGADAVIAHDDYGAALVIQALSRLGLAVPKDVAIVGYQNDLIAHHLNPPLTTLHVPVREIVEQAVEMLIGMIQNPGTQPARQTVTPSLVVRGST